MGRLDEVDPAEAGPRPNVDAPPQRLAQYRRSRQAIAPGGGVDFGARVTAQALAASFGQQIVIENKGGAAGAIGTAMLIAMAIPQSDKLDTTDTHYIG